MIPVKKIELPKKEIIKIIITFYYHNPKYILRDIQEFRSSIFHKKWKIDIKQGINNINDTWVSRLQKELRIRKFKLMGNFKKD